MINEQDRIELAKALAMKKHFEGRLALPRKYDEKIKTVSVHGKKLYDKYQNGKALVEKACDLFELLR